MDAVRFYRYRQLLRHADHNVITVLEAFAWQTSCKTGKLSGIPVWNYGTGQILFETDKQEAHKKEYLNAYFDTMDLLEVILLDPILKTKICENPKLISKIDLHIDPREKSAFKEWQTKHLESIRSAKAVLEETIETSAFIQCRKCKSNAVDTEQKQTRSADEPMTIFCICRNCKERFRID